MQDPLTYRSANETILTDKFTDKIQLTNFSPQLKVLRVGSLCLAREECLGHCGGGVCGDCVEDGHCDTTAEYCAYKYLPAIQNECADYCGSFCLLSSQCGGSCPVCSWGFTCQKS